MWKTSRPGPSGAELLQLVVVDDVFEGARAVEQAGEAGSADSGAVAEHRHEGDDAGAAGDEEEGLDGVGVPDEVAADGSAHFDAVARDEDIVHVGGDFAVADALDGEVDLALSFRLGGDRVAALGLVAILAR